MGRTRNSLESSADDQSFISLLQTSISTLFPSANLHLQLQPLPPSTLGSRDQHTPSTRPEEGKESTNGTIFKEPFEYQCKKRWKWNFQRSELWEAAGRWAALAAALLTLGAHGWPAGCSCCKLHSLRRLHAIVSVSPGVLERLFVLCSCWKVKKTRGVKHSLAPKVQ